MLTVDVPVHSKRERNIRNGFANIRGNWLRAALSLKPSLLAEAMTHPGWVVEYIRHGGTPALGNWLPYAAERRQRRGDGQVQPLDRCRRTRRPGRTSRTTASCSRATWWSRASWTRADAVRCADIGCDGIIVSNHGARQLDQAPASLDVLPAIKARGRRPA